MLSTEVDLLFADTKLRKYIIQHLLIIHFAGDFAEVVEAAADVEGEEVAGEAVVEAGTYIVE